MSQIVSVDRVLGVHPQGFDAQRTSHEALLARAVQLSLEIEKIEGECQEIEARIQQSATQCLRTIAALEKGNDALFKEYVPLIYEESSLARRVHSLWRALRDHDKWRSDVAQAMGTSSAKHVADAFYKLMSDAIKIDLRTID